MLARVADALADPCDDLLERLRAGAAVHMDETGWRTAGERRALWGIFDERHAYLHVAVDRHEDHAKNLLANTGAVVTSDRWWAYSHLPLKRRQICWAHLARDFKAHAEGMTCEKEFGEHGQRICERVFWALEVYQHTHDRRQLQLTIRQLQREFKPVIRRYAGKSPRYRYCRGMARNLLKAWPALLDIRPPPGCRADEQPRRTRSAQRRDLPQAQPRQPIRGRRTARRPPALSPHDLPTPTPTAARLPRRRYRRPQPRRPSGPTHLNPGH
jgi:hypothetical protein